VSHSLENGAKSNWRTQDGQHAGGRSHDITLEKRGDGGERGDTKGKRGPRPGRGKEHTLVQKEENQTTQRTLNLKTLKKRHQLPPQEKKRGAKTRVPGTPNLGGMGTRPPPVAQSYTNKKKYGDGDLMGEEAELDLGNRRTKSQSLAAREVGEGRKGKGAPAPRGKTW